MLKNKVCVTVEPGNKVNNASPVCQGTVMPYEFPIIIAGVTYPRYEKCLRCGKIFPG